jgi:hypothetical protein
MTRQARASFFAKNDAEKFLESAAAPFTLGRSDGRFQPLREFNGGRDFFEMTTAF